MAGTSDDPLRRLGRELRGRVDDELRAEAEERERIAATAARRRRTLTDVAAELCARGDRVRVTVADHTFLGTISRAAGDLVTVRLVSGEQVDCHLGVPVVLEVVERVRQGGRPPGDGVASFRARCFELELDGTPVVVGTTAFGERHGRIGAVAVDHLVVSEDETTAYVPLAAVAYVRAVTAHR